MSIHQNRTGLDSVRLQRLAGGNHLRSVLSELERLLKSLKDLEDRINTVSEQFGGRQPSGGPQEGRPSDGAPVSNGSPGRTNVPLLIRRPRKPARGALPTRIGFPVVVSPRNPELTEHPAPGGGATSFLKRMVRKVFGS